MDNIKDEPIKEEPKVVEVKRKQIFIKGTSFIIFYKNEKELQAKIASLEANYVPDEYIAEPISTREYEERIISLTDSIKQIVSKIEDGSYRRIEDVKTDLNKFVSETETKLEEDIKKVVDDGSISK